MSDETRIELLLGEVLDTGRTPEEVCAGAPGLLWEVRERWELNDLARRLDEQAAVVELRDSLVPAPPETLGSRVTPNARRMLEAIEKLPEDEREVFNLVRIQGLTQAEAAGLLGTSAKTVQRRLNRGILLLSDELADLHPTRPAQPRV